MSRLLALLLLAGCAHRQQMDTPQFHACKLICSAEGYPLASVLEDEDELNCECRKPRVETETHPT